MRSLVIVFTLAASPALAHNELVVARNADNQLVPHLDFDEPPAMEPNTLPEFSGTAWIGINVGVTTLEFDDLTEGLFTLSETSNIDLILVAQTPGGVIFRQLVPMNIGDTFNLGSPFFHQHPIWGRTTGALGDETTFTLRLHDISGTYSDSPDFNVTFTNIPAPGASLLGAAALAAAVVRRRRP